MLERFLPCLFLVGLTACQQYTYANIACTVDSNCPTGWYCATKFCAQGTRDAGLQAQEDAGVDAGNGARPDAGSDAGRDAGVDAGGADAGVDAGADAGAMTSPGGIGAPCNDPTADPAVQSNCAEGDVCVNVGSGECTILYCTSNTQCGTNGTLQNICVTGDSTPNLCVLACNPDAPDPCGREDFLCVQISVNPTTDICIPNCNTQTQLCPYPTHCDPGNGMCTTTACGADAGCPTGLACYAPLGSGGSCVDDCNLAGNACQNGAPCTSGGTCAAVPGTVGIYQPCTAASDCVTGTACEEFAQGGALCLKSCAINSDCAGNGAGNPGSCGLTMTSGPAYCDVTCSSGTGCPAPTQCQTAIRDAMGNKYCVP